MRNRKNNNIAIVDWAIMAAVIMVAVVVAEMAGLSSKLENASIYTVILFVVLIFALRPAWGRRVFWWRLAGVFILHVMIITIIAQFLLVTSQGFRGIPMIICGMAEGLMIGGILWKGTNESSKKDSA